MNRAICAQTRCHFVTASGEVAQYGQGSSLPYYMILWRPRTEAFLGPFAQVPKSFAQHTADLNGYRTSKFHQP